MLPSSPNEKNEVREYYASQSPNETVEFLQKVYAETVAGHRHEVWDVHASDGRWWVITNPTNLYSQDQFPNMDLAVTFHLGLCLRVPREARTEPSAVQVTPFSEVLNAVSATVDALNQSEDSSDYRTIGVRCRENLLAFIHTCQDVTEWSADPPKRSDFRAWSELICNEVLGGGKLRERRLVKTLLHEAWTFSSWLTHSQSATWHDAEAAVAATSSAIELARFPFIRFLRDVPELFPKCNSRFLSPEEGWNEDAPDVIWQRPVCDDCGWTGDAVPIGEKMSDGLIEREGNQTDECGILASPLTHIRSPEP